jgi:hypothetical protein
MIKKDIDGKSLFLAEIKIRLFCSGFDILKDRFAVFR